MLDFICDATYSCAAVGDGGALGHSAGSAVSSSRTGASLADSFLLDCDIAAALGAYPRRQERLPAHPTARPDAGLPLRLYLVSGELLVDLSDDVSLWRPG